MTDKASGDTGADHTAAPRFDRDVPPGGYAWWYIDAVSDDGQCGLVVIAFIGSVFSPYYAWRRRRGSADPFNHCALNVALYGKPRRWTMTERGHCHVATHPDRLSIGKSSIGWEGDSLVIRIDETAVPIPRPVRGEVRLTPLIRSSRSFALDSEQAHRWWPIAPTARVEVRLDAPSLRWEGTGYHDANAGKVPLEASFRRWTWLRAPLSDGAGILYDVEQADGSVPPSLALRIGRDGSISEEPPPPVARLPSTPLWRIGRSMRAEPAATAQEPDARVAKTLEDTPFYARSLVSGRIFGETVTAMHESLWLDRFTLPLVQGMLPFRMPRRG